MKNKKIFLFVAVILCVTMLFSTAFADGEATSGSTDSSVSSANDGEAAPSDGTDADLVESDTGETEEEYESPFYSTIWALLPPLIAIALALITKEVYSSLFIGILVGGLLWSGFEFEGTMTHVLSDGFVGSLSDEYNVGILLFLVILGALVVMMNKAGGSAAFGRWAAAHIKSRIGAQIATIILGIFIFIDDYFNCLTVGSVMRPVTDKQNVSRAKLAYLIDSTAAPVCIIAPVSSWAAAVAAFADGSGMNGFELFVRAIPYNLYALLTIGMMFAITVMKLISDL